MDLFSSRPRLKYKYKTQAAGAPPSALGEHFQICSSCKAGKGEGKILTLRNFGGLSSLQGKNKSHLRDAIVASNMKSLPLPFNSELIII